MARSRLAVALVVPEPLRTEIDGLRRAVGFDLSRIEPHITLVPPVNVREDALPDALAVVRSAAAAHGGPLEVTLGPPASFAPANRVLYLTVRPSPGAEARLLSLRRNLLQGPLAREDHREFVPHVTLTNRVRPDAEIDDAVRLLAGYRVDVAFERVDLLSYDGDARRWSTLADVPLAPRRIVGQGGLSLELTPSTTVDPEAAELCGTEDRPSGRAGDAVVVTARRDGAVVGVAAGRTAGEAAWLDGVVVEAGSRREGIGGHLLAALGHEMACRGARWAVTTGAVDDLTERLLTSRGWGPQPQGSGVLGVVLPG